MIETDGKLSRKEIITTFGEFLKSIRNGRIKRYNLVTNKGCEPIVRDYRNYMESKNYNVGSSQRIGQLLRYDSKRFKFKKQYSKKHKNSYNYYELVKE